MTYMKPLYTVHAGAYMAWGRLGAEYQVVVVMLNTSMDERYLLSLLDPAITYKASSKTLKNKCISITLENCIK